jgi:phenylpropionate dioxygenase-like ring-hydroxylating dioxygenase large terminal subunit
MGIEQGSAAGGGAGPDLSAARLPLAQAETLPPAAYTSPEFFRREVERIFLREWLYVGRADQVKERGDYFTLELLGEKLVVVRDDRGEIRVLSTVCRHRGMEVVSGRGNTRAFECPYHAWTYSLRGDLLGAPEMQRTEGFDRRACALPGLRTEVWEGFVFVSFDSNAKPLGPSLAPLAEQFRNYRMGDLVSTDGLVYECPWNWKVMVENFMECYHHIGLHRQSVEPVMPARKTWAKPPDARWAIVHLPAVRGDISLSGTEGIGAESGFPPIEGLSAEERGRGTVVVVYPTHLVFLLPDNVTIYQVIPHAVDRITLRITICVPRTTAERPEFAGALEQAYEGLATFNREDMAACGVIQHGLSSRWAAPGRYSWLEDSVWQIAQYVAARVSG